MKQRVRKAVFPVAGLGTRILPATKAMPKEMLTVVDRPLIHYAVEEAKAAGIEQFYFVTGRAKTRDRRPFRSRLRAGSDAARARQGRAALASCAPGSRPPARSPTPASSSPLGLGHAVWCARHLVGDEPFAVLLVDDLMVGDPPCLKQMVDAYDETGGNIVAVVEVPREQTSRYGVLDIVEDRGSLVRAKGVVEKPNAGRGALDPDDHRPLHHPAARSSATSRPSPAPATRSSSPTGSPR